MDSLFEVDSPFFLYTRVVRHRATTSLQGSLI
jgi:hypothetical protein